MKLLKILFLFSLFSAISILTAYASFYLASYRYRDVLGARTVPTSPSGLRGTEATYFFGLDNGFSPRIGTLLTADYSSADKIKESLALLKDLSPRAYVVQSGSMEPIIGVGSVVVSFPYEDYREGDVVTFYPEASKKSLVTHRIVKRDISAAGVSFSTAGDANEDADPGSIKESQIVGRVVFSLPYLGYVVDFAKTPRGFIFLVIVPATIVVYEELKNLSSEGKKGFVWLKNRIPTRKRDDDSEPKKTIATKEFKLPKWSFILPVVGALVVIVPLTSSYFLDFENTLGNILGVATDYGNSPTPTPLISPTVSPTPQIGNVVINEAYYFVHNDHKITESESDSEWVELFNNSASPVSLKGWSISDNTSCDNFPGEPVIPAYGFAILTVVTEAEFESVWTVPEGIVYIQSPTAIGNGLANNDELVLRDANCGNGNIVDQISWGSNTNGLNPSIPMTARGSSSERSPDGVDTDSASDFVETSPPTPGQ